MEYERFFHFSSDAQLAKWYLLTGSSAVPQRMLCLRDYAVKKDFAAFGHFSKQLRNTDKEQVYCYVIVNIFDIPFNELVNFFVLSCDNKTIGDDEEQKNDNEDGDNVYDIDFEKSFVSATEKTVPNINISTNTAELSSSYLAGVNDFMPEIDWQLDVNVMPCTKSTTAPNTSIRQAESADDADEFDEDNEMDTLPPQEEPPAPQPINRNKRRITEEDSSALDNEKPSKMSPSGVQILDNVKLADAAIIPPSSIIDQNVFYDASVNTAPVLPDNINPEFPSIAPPPPQQQQSPPPPPRALIEKSLTPPITSDVTLSFDGLRQVRDLISSEPREDWFNIEINGKVIEYNDRLYFVNKNFEGVPDDTMESYEMDDNVRLRYNLVNRERFNVYPTYFDNTTKRSLIMNLCKVEKTNNLFKEYVQRYGREIVYLVDSENDVQFANRIQELKNDYYWLLAGLFTYLKRRDEKFTTYMEIMASLTYGSMPLMLVSNLLVRVYLAAKNEPMKITENTINFYHIQNMDIPDADVKKLDDLMLDSLTKAHLNTAIPKIQNNGFEFVVDAKGEITSDSYFCNNLFCIDEGLHFIVTSTADVFLAPTDIRNRTKLSSNILYERYASLPNVFDAANTKYLGLARYLRQLD